MPATTERLKDLVTDLRSNWYVRFWFILWIPFAILAFVCLVELGHQSEQAKSHKEVEVSFGNQSYLIIPNFHFHTDGTDTISNSSCTYRNSPIQTGPCSSWNNFKPNPLNCQAVLANTLKIIPQIGQFTDLGISCNISMEGNDSQYGQVLGWGFDGFGNFVGGPVGHTPFYIHPTAGAIIELTKGEIIVNSHLSVDDWGARLQYFSSNSTAGFFHVRVQVMGFGVFTFRLENVYDGWKAVGGIGGFFWFMVFCHTIVMIVVGFFLSNKESLFLNPPTKQASHSAGGEYKALDS